MPSNGCGRIRERTLFATGGLDASRRAQNFQWPTVLSLVDCELRCCSRERSLRESEAKTPGLRKDSVPLRRQLVQCAILFRSSIPAIWSVPMEVKFALRPVEESDRACFG